MAVEGRGRRPEVVYFPSDMAMEVLDYEKQSEEPGVLDSLRTMAVWVVWWGVVGVVLLLVLVVVLYCVRSGVDASAMPSGGRE